MYKYYFEYLSDQDALVFAGFIGYLEPKLALVLASLVAFCETTQHALQDLLERKHKQNLVVKALLFLTQVSTENKFYKFYHDNSQR